MTVEVPTIFINFVTPGAEIIELWRSNINHTVKIHYFFKNFYTRGHRPDKLNQSHGQLRGEGSNKIVNYINLRVGVVVLGRSHIGFIAKIHLFI